MALVGCYVALTKPLAAALPVFLLAWLRFGIGAVAMAPWLKKPADEPAMTARTRWLLFAESFFGNFLFTFFMINGVRLTNAAAASVIMAGIPAVVAVMGWLLLRERIGLRIALSIACAVVGVVLMALAPATADAAPTATSTAFFVPLRLWGYASLACAVLCEAAYSIIGKQLTGTLGPKRISALINLWGWVLCTPFGLYLARDFAFGSVPSSMWVLLVFYALAASMGSVWLWMTGLRAVPASQAGVFTVMLPISTALTGVAVLGERLTLWQWLALAIALAGVLIATLPGTSFLLRRAP